MLNCSAKITQFKILIPAIQEGSNQGPNQGSMKSCEIFLLIQKH